MYVSDVTFHVSWGFVYIAEEARKKRTFFPEDKIDSEPLFHLCLLSSFGVVELAPLIRQQADGLHKNKNPFIHIRDEGLLRGTTRIRH